MFADESNKKWVSTFGVGKDQIPWAVVVVLTRRLLARECDVISRPEEVLGHGELKATVLPEIDLSWRVNRIFFLSQQFKKNSFSHLIVFVKIGLVGHNVSLEFQSAGKCVFNQQTKGIN